MSMSGTDCGREGDEVCLRVLGTVSRALSVTASPKLGRGHPRANFLHLSLSVVPFLRDPSLRSKPHLFPHQQERVSETPSTRQLRVGHPAIFFIVVKYNMRFTVITIFKCAVQWH